MCIRRYANLYVAHHNVLDRLNSHVGIYIKQSSLISKPWKVSSSSSLLVINERVGGTTNGCLTLEYDHWTCIMLVYGKLTGRCMWS
jgi:hypothetical protein